MGLKYKDLTDEVRQYTLEEIALYEKNGILYESPRLTENGCGQWPDILKSAASDGTDENLARAILANGCLKTHMPRKKPTGGHTMAKVPVNAHETLAEDEFNWFYIRGLCRFALDNGTPHLVGYRARFSQNPRSSSEEAVGQHFDPANVLEDLRTAQGRTLSRRCPAVRIQGYLFAFLNGQLATAIDFVMVAEIFGLHDERLHFASKANAVLHTQSRELIAPFTEGYIHEVPLYHTVL
ncbi:hypothetical protein B5C34_06635 [Pacificimonas flava]|uniref:Uncharacterized protein n=2 Tax=Pacificimonas TaxID=1960290 RepID=A0A219B464_9SPHN|nr:MULTISPECIES: hypothetical protein [Pacificimonas]MBZ6377100.1 hypothetical protein [Pacificimonas aurantium]OWV33170.1 hypothetical protein B5C34_06635 [Pacificimonas flava]